MDVVRILYVTQEIFPYVPETEISKISRELPQSIQELGREIRIFMPKYGCINERRNQLHEVIRLSGMNLIIDDTDHQLIIKVASIPSARMQVYFIDNDDFFHRKSLVADENGVEFADNGERSVFFARSVLETVKKLRWSPDIIHCHGWMSSVLPILVKKVYKEDPYFASSKLVYSIYDHAFHTPLNDSLLRKIKMDGIEESDLSALKQGCDFAGLSALAIDYCDGVIQGSKTIDARVVDYANKSKKLFLSYQSPENYVPLYDEFYNRVLGQ